MSAAWHSAGDVAGPVAARLERHGRAVRSSERGCVATALGLVVVGVVVALRTILPEWVAAAAGAIAVFLIVVLVVVARDVRDVRLVPYFREAVPGPFTLARGRALLRWSGVLDRIARERGVTLQFLRISLHCGAIGSRASVA